MKATTFWAGVCVAAASLLVGVRAQAAPVPLYTFTTGYNTDINSFNIGNEFQTNQTLYVSAIGALLANSQISGGLSTVQYTATLYASDAVTVLASETIPVGTPVDAQNFAYVPLTYQLSANTNYVLTSYAGPGASMYSYGFPATPTGTWNLGSTFIQNWYGTGSGAPTNHNGGYLEFLGGNLIVDNVAPPLPPAPEPTSALLLGLGWVLVARKVRSCRRTA